MTMTWLREDACHSRKFITSFEIYHSAGTKVFSSFCLFNEVKSVGESTFLGNINHGATFVNAFTFLRVTISSANYA